MATLQEQGVPWSDRLGPRPNSRGAFGSQRKSTPLKQTHARRVVQRRMPLSGEMGGTQVLTDYYESPAEKQSRRNRSLRDFNPAKAGESAGGSVGMLEAEFIIAIGLLILLAFSDNSSAYGTKIMSLMKRGSLTCLLFFILAIVSEAGPNAAKIVKAFGALMIVAIVVTSPVNTVVKNIDALIKNDWVGSDEHGNDTSADSGTSANSSNAAENALNTFVQTIEGELKTQGQSVGSNPITSGIKNAAVSTLNGIIPGLGDVVSKLGL
jgi:hypothetical protein